MLPGETVRQTARLADPPSAVAAPICCPLLPQPLPPRRSHSQLIRSPCMLRRTAVTPSFTPLCPQEVVMERLLAGLVHATGSTQCRSH